MVQRVINNVRFKLMPYIGVDSYVDNAKNLFKADFYYAGQKLGNIIKKIPPQNYEKLRKYVPIGWLKI